MFLTNRGGATKWADIMWLPALPVGASQQLAMAVSATEGALVNLWANNGWEPGKQEGAGLVFPVDLDSLRRVHSEPRKVLVGYAVCDGNIAGGVILHMGTAIGEYAKGTVAWAERELSAHQVAFVRSLCVSPHLRGFGIGRTLLGQARKMARHLGAPVVVGHLRVAPDKDQRVEQAYRDAGFSVTGSIITTTVRKTVDHKWQEYFGREHPVDLAWLPGSTELTLQYLPVAAPSAKHRFGTSGHVEAKERVHAPAERIPK